MAVEYRVGIDWDDDGDTGDYGEDVTSRVLGNGQVTISYGRDQIRQLSPQGVGEAALIMDNASGDYNPENPASPLAGMVLPGRRIEITATLDTTEHTLYRGRLDDYEVLPDLAEQRIRLSCLDPLAALRGVRVSTGLHHAVRTGDALGLLLDAAGWTGPRDLDQGATTVPWWWLSDTDAYDAATQLVDSEGPGALLTVDSSGGIVFRSRHHRLLSAASTTVQATWRGDGIEPLLARNARYDHGWRNIVNAMRFSVLVREPSGERQVVWQAPAQIVLADGETASLVAVAAHPFLDAVPPDVTDYTLASGVISTALSSTSGQRTTVYLTAAGGPAVITSLRLRAYPVTTVTTVEVGAEDPVSIGRYGRRDWPSVRDPVWASVHDAAAIAALIVGQYADRLPTVTVSMVGATGTRLGEMLGRDLADRIHITDTVTGVDDDFLIERIQHVIVGDGVQHKTTFGCEKVPEILGNVFRFDVSGQGFDDGVFAGIGRDDPANIFLFDVSGQGFDDGVFAH